MTERVTRRSKSLTFIRVAAEPVTAYEIHVRFGWLCERAAKDMLRVAADRGEIRQVLHNGLEAYTKALRAKTLTPGSLADRMLLVVREKGAMTRKSVAQLLEVPATSMAGAIRVLLRKRLIDRVSKESGDLYFCVKRGPEPARLPGPAPKFDKPVVNSIFAMGAL